jgi:hypothetical protein
MNGVTHGTGEADDPWLLKTPPQTAVFEAWRDPKADPPALDTGLPVRIRQTRSPPTGVTGLVARLPADGRTPSQTPRVFLPSKNRGAAR